MVRFPNCKINIGLDVLRRREDGFHDLDSVLSPVSGLCDILEIVPSGEPSGVQWSCSGLTMDCAPQENLCVRAYYLMAERFTRVKGVKIHLHKIIPFGAGLGGGSSDAATTVRELNNLFTVGLSESAMESICAELGSDTAFFIRNTPQLASGRGEILEPVELPIKGMQLVIIKPDMKISTAQAYGGIVPYEPSVPLSERLQAPIEEWRDSITNAFEPYAFGLYPILGEIKQQIYNMGAIYASMSGSGTAIYGIFDSDKDIIEVNLPDMFFYRQTL